MVNYIKCFRASVFILIRSFFSISVTVPFGSCCSHLCRWELLFVYCVIMDDEHGMNLVYNDKPPFNKHIFLPIFTTYVFSFLFFFFLWIFFSFPLLFRSLAATINRIRDFVNHLCIGAARISLTKKKKTLYHSICCARFIGALNSPGGLAYHPPSIL